MGTTATCCASTDDQGKCCHSGSGSGKTVEGAPQTSEVMGVPPTAPPGVDLKASLMGGNNADTVDGADKAAGGRPIAGKAETDGKLEHVTDFEGSDGSKYTGQLRNNMKHGQGRREGPGGSYEGEWEADQQHGRGKQVWTDGRTFEGEFVQGKFEGHGHMVWHTQKGELVYEGQYKADLKHGIGKFSWGDGRAYDGQWHAGMRHGRGEYTNAANQKKFGYWTDDKFDRWESKGETKS